MYFVNPPCMKQNCGHSCHEKKTCNPYDVNPYKYMNPMNASQNQYKNMHTPYNQYPEMPNQYNQFSNMNEPYPLNFQMPEGSQIPVFATAQFAPPSTVGGMAMPTDLSSPPETLTDIYFTPGFLRTQIGKTMRVEFLMGTNAPLVDRIGKLTDVGASYILIEPVESNDIIMCDIYSIKFVTILNP